MSEIIAKKRYPGAKPFTQEDKHIFFGREKDIEQIYKFIRQEKLVVLYAKSGLGKSSLLNAGIIPKFLAETKTDKTNESPDYQPITIRFGAYTPARYDEQGKLLTEESPPPLTVVRERIAQVVNAGNTQSPDTFLDLIYNEDVPSLWQFAQACQITQAQMGGWLLVFDQFEELFSYPEAEINALKQQLAELLYTDLPQRWRNALNHFLDENPGALRADELNQLYQSFPAKLVLAIREDKLYQLDHLADQLPGILHKRYMLNALTREQAREAIVAPAVQIGDFISPNFEFEEAAIELIINYLQGKGDQVKGIAEIESFQIQLICQHIEENIVIKNQDLYVEVQDLGKSEGLQQIAENYYLTQIEKLSKADQQPARVFVEEYLVNEKDHTRVSVPESFAQTRVSPAVLQTLVNSHLLRAETNARGNRNIEVSHDTLVMPILKYKDIRLAQEAQEAKAQEAELKRQAELRLRKQQRRRFWMAVVILLNILLAIFGAGYYALILINQANKAEKKAVLMQKQAVYSELQAEKMQKQAQTEKANADIARDLANKKTQEAKEAQKLAEAKDKEAKANLEQAEKAQKLAEAKDQEAKTNLQKAEALLLDIANRELSSSEAELNKINPEAAYPFLKAAFLSKDAKVQAQILDKLAEIAFIELHQKPLKDWQNIKSLTCLQMIGNQVVVNFEGNQPSLFSQVIAQTKKLNNKTQARQLVVKEMERYLGKERMQKAKKKYYPM
jgi:hypothetical protein